MNYILLKTVHQAAVALSITGFIARGLASLGGAAWVRGRAARTLPHVVDTVLLLSAIALAWTASLNPLHAPWLMAKIVALVAYVALGAVALRPAVPWRLRCVAFGAALATFGYIGSVAMTKKPSGFFALL